MVAKIECGTAVSNFNVDAISFQIAAGLILGFILYFVMAMLMYRDIAIHRG